MKKQLLLLAFACFFSQQIFSQNINTIAGTGASGFSGDGASALLATFTSPYGAIADPAGNVYIADPVNARVRKINTLGIVTTYAGNGSSSSSGDGGAATSAGLNWPAELALDANGNLYIGEYFGNRVRKVTPGGIITTFAGNGSGAFSGDGGPASSAAVNGPWGIDFDTAGNLYIACRNDNRIRKVNTSGVISTVAGTGGSGYTGDGGPALSATFSGPIGMAVDMAGNLYVCENGNHTIRKINTSGIITTVAGTGISGYTADGIAATSSMLNSPVGMDCDPSGILYIADQSNNRIRKVDLLGIITTVAGNGASAFGGDGGLATLASLNTPQLVHVDASGNLYIGDTNNNRIRKVGASSSISITCSPNDTVCAGTSITFTATPIGVGTPHYQWKKNGLNVGTDNSSYTLSGGFSSGDIITCEVSSSLGGSVLATSNAIAVYIRAYATASRTLTICEPNSIRLAGVDVYVSGSYYDTLRGASSFGCDSILRSILTVNMRSRNTRSVSICEPATFYAQGANRNTSGTYIDTLRSANFHGCDSILTTVLTVNSRTYGSRTVDICEPATFYAGGANRAISGTYYDTLRSANANGCDSTITTILNIHVRSSVSRNITICPGSSIYLGGALRSASGTFNDTLSNINGCDSFLQTILSVNDAILTDQSLHICPGEQYSINGHNYSSSGTYKDTLTAAGGCDSIVITHLTVSAPHAPLISGPTSVVTGQSASYFVNGSPALTYSWSIDNGTINYGALTDSMYATLGSPGICHVTVTATDSSGCDSSRTITVNVQQSGVGIKQLDAAIITLYPNPASDILQIEMKGLSNESLHLSFINAIGQSVVEKDIQIENANTLYSIDISTIPSGMYICKMSSQSIDHCFKWSKVNR